MRKGNKIFEALGENFERKNFIVFKGYVKPNEEAALDELFAIPQPVASPLLDGMQDLPSETGAAGAPARARRRRGGSTAPGVGGSCPPTTNRGA